MRWDQIIVATLKAHNVNLVTYVPDNVLKPVIEGIHADPFFTAFTTTREEEAIGIVSGAGMAGRKGVVLMQSSGFATLARVAKPLLCISTTPLRPAIPAPDTIPMASSSRVVVKAVKKGSAWIPSITGLSTLSGT